MSHKPRARKTPVSAIIPAKKPASTIPSFDAFADNAWIRAAQLLQSPKRPGSAAPVPFSEPTYWRKIQTGLWTKPVKLSARVSAQRVGDCRALLAAYAAGKSDDEIRELVNRLHAKRAEAVAG